MALEFYRLMILIISNEHDLSTDDVIDWLLFYDVEFIRINDSTKVIVNKVFISDSNFEIELLLQDNFKKDFYLNLSTIKAVWYRRGEIRVDINLPTSKTLDKNEVKRLWFYLKKEKQDVEYLIYYYLNQKRHINTFYDDDINKNHVLIEAERCGLKIPKTLITSSKAVLKKFHSKKEIITKAIKFGAVTFDKRLLSAGTELYPDNLTKELPNFFFPTLFQEKIEKKYEIRSFFIHGKFYSTAIFSQADSQTSIDFRNYNYEKPNRTPPFNLPTEIQEKLKLLMKVLNLNSGSIDLIVTKENQFIFLEVNPIGQFAQVSNPGNFFIEERIAKFLKNEKEIK